MGPDWKCEIFVYLFMYLFLYIFAAYHVAKRLQRVFRCENEWYVSVWCS